MSVFVKRIVVLAAVLLFVASPAVHAWWVPNGVGLCTAAGTQQSPCVCSDGAGGAIVAWADNYSGAWDIFAQRVSATGKPLWATDGIALCTAAGNQLSPVIVSDGSGGAIVAWYDDRSGNQDIYAQRVSAAGSARWAANGVALCTAALNQQLPGICTDGAGGAIVAWPDGRGDTQDIYAQRVSALGATQWTANGEALCMAVGSQSQVSIAADGFGGALVTWRDVRNANVDVYAQRIDGGGSVEWTDDGVAVCTTSDAQYEAAIAGDGTGGAFVAWKDDRGTYDNIYAQRVNASGAVQWAAGGIAVCASSAYQSNHVIVSDGGTGAIVLWQENRGSFSVFAQRLNAAGSPLWTASGVLACSGLTSFLGMEGVSDGLGGAIVSWHESTDLSYDVYAQRVGASGSLPWGTAKRTVCATVGYQDDPSLAPDGAGGAIVAWADSRTGTDDIYAQLVDPAGRVGWLAPEIQSVIDVPGDQGGRVFLSWYAARADRFMDGAMSHYTIWRSIDPALAAARIEGGAAAIESLAELGATPAVGAIRIDETGALSTLWELVDTQDALFMSGYSKTEATLYDSTAYYGEPMYFQVIAHTSDPTVYWISASGKGYSIDNLPPGAPAGFAGERVVVPAGLALTWEPNVEGDLSGYALYRGTSADFVPGAGNLIGQLDETEYFDGEWNWGSGYFYKLSAIDVNGNESPYALFSPDDLTGVDAPTVPAATYLAQNFPNPFNPATRIAYGLSAPARVSLRIYDASGRLVRVLIDEARQAGAFAEMWDGRDSRGAQVASGIYFYRLEAGAFSETRKMALLR